MVDRIRQSIFGLSCRITSCDIEDTIVVTGQARSGTTWLAEMLRSLPNYKCMNEPLSTGSNPEVGRNGFDGRNCLAPGDRLPEFEAYMERILTGQMYKSWLWRFEADNGVQRLAEQLSNRKLVVKFIRARRMVQWLPDRFDVRGAVHIIRHPCAVVASMREMKWYRQGKLREFHGDSMVDQVIISPIPDSVRSKFDPVLQGIDTNEEVLAARWCLDHYFLFHHHATDGNGHPWILTSYERLLTEAEQELKRIVGAFGEKVPDRMREQFDVPSSSAASSLETDRIQRQLSKWRDKLDAEQIEDILRVVDEFGLDFYAEDLHPDYDRLMQYQRKAERPTPIHAA
jgi:hypothetical protein